ncbi:hypothetical protein PspLS_01931 [Pyricularia sp. CBS 133598]|nr:hypothetical protein PspLS_01931 [Pyricularia sp. CBS 133598]
MAMSNMQFSKFAILLASASALAAPLDVEADTGNALVGGNALVPRQPQILPINLGLTGSFTLGVLAGPLTNLIPGLLPVNIPALLNTLIVSTLGLPASVANQLLPILSQVRSGIDAPRAGVLAQVQGRLNARLQSLGGTLSPFENLVLQQVNTALANIGTVPGRIVNTAGVTTGQVEAIIATLPADLRAAIKNAIDFFKGIVPTINADNSVTITRS